MYLFRLVTENKLITMHRGSNFKFGGTVGKLRDRFMNIFYISNKRFAVAFSDSEII